MNITDMTTQAKSVLLVGLMPDWKISPHWSGDMYVKVGDTYEVALSEPHYLYDQRVMWLAWRVLNWAADNQMIIDACREDSFMEDIEQYWSLPPVEAQRIWLDKILELCLEGGLITP